MKPHFRPAFADDVYKLHPRIRELDAFVGNLVPRINRYAQVEQGKRDKRDVIAAEKAFATITDKLQSYKRRILFFQL